MPLIIYGVPTATCVRRVATVCKELALAYELKIVGKDVIKSPEYMENKQPFGQMPVLEDGAVVVYGRHF